MTSKSTALIDRILASSKKIEGASLLSDSTFLKSKQEEICTEIPEINLAFSGHLEGGLTSGVHIIAGPSRHFKTNLALQLAKAYLNTYPDSIILFYDSEFGTTETYFSNSGVDPSRVLHIPVKNIEEITFHLAQQLENNISQKDKVFILIDSIGNLASKREVENALNENSAQDMTRAKALKGLFRVITPYFTLHNIPLICINHVYANIGGYGQSMSGGTGPLLSANSVFFIGRQQGEKEDDELLGYKFTINIEKSRRVREKKKISFDVNWDEGIIPYSGIFEIARDLGWIISPNKGWYSFIDKKTGEVIFDKNLRKDECLDPEKWKIFLSKTSFNTDLYDNFSQDVKGNDNAP